VTDLAVETTPIEGLLVVRLPVHADNRGWFKENWQRAKMTALGVPDFTPVQQNVSFNQDAGATRGLHAEPWDKFVSVATGRVFGAWVDLREGPGLGQSFSIEVTPEVAVFVPRGVANGYQTLEPETAYVYLVNAHWSVEKRAQYSFVNLADPTVGIQWPLPLEPQNLSAADQEHPAFEDVLPLRRRQALVIGANGQLGRALRQEFPEATFADQSDYDLADPDAPAGVDWDAHDLVINAAAYTAVDAAETDQGRRDAWETNVTGVARLVEACRRHGLPLVHVSSDYVFDGQERLHTESEPLAPLSSYGTSKAAGDVIVSGLAAHYVIRTSWLTGEGNNFVRTMVRLARAGVSPSVVDDQFGRPTFADELAQGIAHLVRSGASFGTYNLTSGGEVTTWADLARAVFEQSGREASEVTSVTTEEYAEGKSLAVRPRFSALDLGRIEAIGFVPRDWRASLQDYLAKLPAAAPGEG
jgi:dTDP-4-dehydrorhamnose reductase